VKVTNNSDHPIIICKLAFTVHSTKPDGTAYPTGEFMLTYLGPDKKDFITVPPKSEVYVPIDCNISWDGTSFFLTGQYNRRWGWSIEVDENPFAGYKMFVEYDLEPEYHDSLCKFLSGDDAKKYFTVLHSKTPMLEFAVKKGF
jgi:hypothetical protein